MSNRLLIITALLSLFGCSTQAQNTIDENDTIVSFSFGEGGGMAVYGGFGYEIKETSDNKVHFLFDKGLPWEKEFSLDDHSVFDSLQKVIMEHKMYAYKGHYSPDTEVLDGSNWWFNVTYASGKSIDVNGYSAMPEGSHDAFNAIHACLKKWKDMPIEANKVVSFTYHYGDDTYSITPEGDHAILTLDNETTGVHQRFEKDSQLLEDLRVLFLEYDLRMNAERRQDREDCTLWDYEISYSNGDHYEYYSSDCGFKCGYTGIIQGFLSRWTEEKTE